MTYSIKIEEQSFRGLTVEQMDSKVRDLKDVGIRKMVMVESEGDAVATQTFMQAENNAREILNKRLAGAKKKLQSEYAKEVDLAWEEYNSNKQAAIDALKDGN